MIVCGCSKHQTTVDMESRMTQTALRYFGHVRAEHGIGNDEVSGE